jgi:hypothetical protein
MIAVGDLNGDGIADFVWEDTSTNPSKMAVLLSQPGGGWLPGTSISLPPGVGGFADCLIADFNRDGRQDLVCASAYQFSSWVNVFFGNGDGTFQPPVSTALPADSSSYVSPLINLVGDLNGDGFPDLNEIDPQSQVSIILLSDGKGGFKAPIAAPTGINSFPPVAADVNGDGIPDLLFPLGPEVALGNGNGTFKPAINYATSSDYDATCAFHDMDGDGHLDAVCGYDESTTGDITGASDLIVLHGNPDGSFNTTPIAHKIFGDHNTEYDGFGTFQTPIAVADLNGDGIPDIMATSGDGLAVLLGGPSLAFSTPLHYAQAVVGYGGGIIGPYQSLIYDVNGDGIPDAVNAGPNGIYISYGKPDGSFGSAFAPEVTEVIGYPTIADFNGDGIPDVAATGDTAIKLSLGKGDGTFAPPVALPNNNGAIDFSTPLWATDAHILHGDFNGDGKVDLLAIGSSGIYVYNSYILFGNGDGTFQEPILVPGTAAYYPMYEQLFDAAVFDINHDGRSDLLGANTSLTGLPTGQIAFALSNGDGTFKNVATTVPVDQGSPSYPYLIFPALADFDGDGELDAAYGSYANAYVVKGNGDGTFATTGVTLPIPSISGAPSLGSLSVATGDFDGDGNQDFALLVQYGGGMFPFPSTLATAAWVYYGNGKGAFSAPVLVGTFDRNYTNIAAADLNQDGLTDIVLRTSGSLGGGYAVGVVNSQPGRSFGPEVNYTAGTGVSSLAITDVNLDGFPDLIFGNGDYNVRASSITVLLNLGNTQVVTGSIVAQPEPSFAGQAFTLVATFTPPTPTALNGSVAFYVDGSAVGSATLSGNAASLVVPGTYSIGQHTIAATWPGDSTYAAVTASGAHAVIGVATATTLISSSNPAQAGTSITFTATTTSANGVPAGSTAFSDGNAVLGQVNLVNGVSTYTTSSLSVGTHPITASYGGSSTFDASSASLSQVIQEEPSATVLVAAPNPAYAGQSVKLTSTTTATTGTPSGTVSFFDGATPLGTSALDSSGTATLTTTFSAAGTHLLTAAYSGDMVFDASTSATYSEVILLNPTSVAVAASPNPAAVFQNISFTATITSSTGSGLTGSISFLANGTKIGAGVIQNGTAAFSTSSLNAGTYAITATFDGNASFGPDTSAPLLLVVVAEASQTSLTSSLNPATVGSSATFTASVSAATGSPSGTVQFFDGNAALGAPTTLNGQAIATYTTNTLTIGTHPITAVYLGNSNMLQSTSGVLQQMMTAYAGDFSITVNPPSAGAYTGEAASFHVNVTSTGGFNEPLALSCAGLPAAATCTFAPTSLPSGQGSATLVIQSSAPHLANATSTAAIHDPRSGVRVGTASFLAGAILLLVPGRRKCRGLWIALLGVCAALGVAACSAPGSITGETPPGTYPVQVTATYAGSSPNLQHSALVILTVKSLF